MTAGRQWRQAGPADLPAIMALHEAALAVDGGTPFAADEWLMRRWYIDGVGASLAVFDGGELAGICACRPGRPDGSPAKVAGVVGPAWRGQGLGGRLLDFGLAAAGTAAGLGTAGRTAATVAAAGPDSGTAPDPPDPPGAPVVVETESLTEAADALYRSRGLRQVFAEDVMTRPLTDEQPGLTADPGISFVAWNEATAPRFFAVWTAAFRERPGFPGWDAATWISRISDDEDFRAEWTLLAQADGIDAGFVAGAAGGWIVQTGVIPAARGRRISGQLITEVLGRMREAGETRAVLTVNVNNPAAIAVYERLGFTATGRRARYERAG